MPSRDTFDGSHEQHKIYAINNTNDPFEYVKTIKNELGPDIFICKENAPQALKIAKLMEKHRTVFAIEDRPIGHFTSYEAEIPTIEGRSASMHQYKVPVQYEEAISAEIERLKRMKVLTKCPNNRGFNTPLQAVPKPDQKIRLVINFKPTLNKILVDEDSFCVPDLMTESIIPPNMKYFLTLDVRAGYWNVPVKKEHQHKLSIMWKSQNLMFQRLPFGLKTSGSIFSRALAHSLESVENKENFKCYIDDLFIFASDFQTFYETVDQIFGLLNKFGWVVAGNKVFALYNRVKWLGRIITPLGTTSDPGNANAFQKITPPKTYKGLQSLIGAMNWLRQYAAAREDQNVAAKSFSAIIKPISNLLKTNKPGKKLIWTREADQALEIIKDRLSSEMMIYHPDWNSPFTLTTDASLYAMGYALTQCVGGRWRIIRVNSKTLNDAQTRYSATEREALAVVWAVTDAKIYLRGRRFTVRVDHRALTFLDCKIPKNDKICRWFNTLSSYNFVVTYLPGTDNCVADFLSRNPEQMMSRHTSHEPSEPVGRFVNIGKFQVYVPSWVDTDNDCNIKIDGDDLTNPESIVALVSKNDGEMESSVKLRICSEQYADENVKKILDSIEHGYEFPKLTEAKDDDEVNWLRRHRAKLSRCEETGALLVLDKIYVPRALRPEILRRYHNDNNHMGAARMKDAMAHLTWPDKTDDIVNFSRSCICQHRKGGRGQSRNPEPKSIPKGNRIFQHILVDFVDMPVTKLGFRYILTVICTYSRFLIAVPSRNHRAVDAVKGIKEHVLHKFPRVESISSDRGRHFISEMNKQFAALHNITWRYHTSYRPQSTGLLEVQHRSIKDALFIMVHETQSEWTECIQHVVSTINRLPNCSTKISPFEVVYLEKPQLSEYDLVNRTEELSIDEYTKRRYEAKKVLHETLQKCQEQADAALRKQSQPKVLAPEISEGDSVLLHRPFSATAKRTKVPWLGPFEVTATNGSVVRIKDLEGVEDWVHRTQVQKIERRKQALGPLPWFPDFRIPLRATQFQHESQKVQLNEPKRLEMRDPTPGDTAENLPTKKPPSEHDDQAADLTFDEFHTPPTSPEKDRFAPTRAQSASPARIARRNLSPGPMKTRSMTKMQRGEDKQTQDLLKNLAPFQLRRSSRNRKTPK